MKRYKLHDLLRAAAATFLATSACGNSGGNASPGAGADTAADNGATGSDTGTSADSGSGGEVIADAQLDAGADSTADSALDSGTVPDATAPVDSSKDTAADTGQVVADATAEVKVDTVADVAKDVAVDASKPSGPFPCVDPQPVMAKGIDTGVDTCKNGMLRRRAIVTCPSVLPEVGKECNSGGGGGPAGECKTDVDCAKVKGGHCEVSIGPGVWCYCASSCETDADCGSGHLCLCGPKFGTCVAAKCNSGADCAVGDCVSYTANPGCGSTAMVCENSGDSCGAQSDCPNGQECTWDTPKGKKYCSPPMCGIGRPFVVQGSWRMAEVVDCAPASHRHSADGATSAAWLATVPADLLPVLAQHWETAAQMEHASVAAFARLALELLAVGAPLDLVERAQLAGADEVRHAQVCLSLAQRFDGKRRSFGPLTMVGVAIDTDLASIAASAVAQGCVVETCAALEARIAAEQAVDADLKAALSQIADDEARHAELSWAIAKWAQSRAGVTGAADVVVAMQTAFVQAVDGLRSAEVGAELPPQCGVLAGRHLAALRAHAISQIIEPAWRRLVGENVDLDWATTRSERIA